jgi:hypothetical protein
MKVLTKVKFVLVSAFVLLVCQQTAKSHSNGQTSGQNQQSNNLVYVKIMAGPGETFSIRSLQVVINDKRLTTNLATRVKESYTINPSNSADYLFNKSGSTDIRTDNGIVIEKNGVVVYRIAAKQSVTAVNVIATFGLSVVPGKIVICNDPDFKKDCYDLSDYLLTDNHIARLNCMVNFSLGKTAMDGETWSGTFYSDKWGLPEFWWYNLAKIISCNTEYEYWNESSMDFWIRAKSKNINEPGIIGVYVQWHVNLDAGYKYFFTLVSDSLPDYVLVNNKKVWSRQDGYFDNLGQISFSYVPAIAEPANIAFIKDIRGKEEVLLDLNKALFSNRFYCTRSKFEGMTPEYTINTLPEHTLFTGINPFIACKQLNSFGLDPVNFEARPLKMPGYSAQDMLMLPLPKFFLKSGLYKDIKDLGIRGVLANGRPIERLEVYKNLGIKHLDFYIGTIKDKNGTYSSASVNLSGVLGSNLEENVKSALPELANEWLGMVPDGTVSILFHEVNDIFGNWSRDIHLSKLSDKPEYANIGNASVPDAFRMHFRYLNGLISDIKSKVKPELRNRLKIMFLYDHGAYNGAYIFKSGADIFINKQIHRQSVNIVVANARGNAGAVGKEYGFDCDTWDRCFYHSYHPDEAAQIMRVYYHAGGKYLFTEMSTTSRGDSGVTALGKEWLDFIKYANRHPLRGTQQVKIGIMRGFDEWLIAASPSSSWESEHRTKEIMGQNYLTDFNLLNIVFSNYGRYDLTSTDRLCTGTPYGPVNMIPWDATGDVLKKYEIIMLLGVNNMDAPQFANLREYVKNGGVLFLAVGHLKNEKRDYPGSDITNMFGVKINEEKYFSGKPYTSVTVTGKEAQIMSRLGNQDPLVVRNNYGAGECYLFTGEHVTEFGEEVPANIITQELENVKWISFSPYSDKMEYMVQKKGSLFIFSLFNHGNVGFPSGNGLKRGPWTGSLKINAGLLNLKNKKVEAYKVIYNEQDEDPFTLEKLEIENIDNELRIHTGVDKFSEIVIGPEGEVQKGYF